jgi:hypothetical protein
MESGKFRVVNRSREGFLKLEITVVNTTAVPFRKLLEDLAYRTDVGVWLTPYRGIPTPPGLPPLDIVYLNENHRVLQEVESYPSPLVRPLKGQPASALVLAAHTVFASQLQPGDQLAFDSIEEAEGGSLPEFEAKSLNAVLPAANTPSEPLVTSGAPVSFLPEDFAGQQEAARLRLQQADEESQNRGRASIMKRFLRWLAADPRDRRRASRHPLPGLVIYQWTGGAPKAYHVGNISRTGCFLLTDERPYPGTLILMTLQRTDRTGDDPEDTLAIHAKVVRWGPDGVGLQWVPLRTSAANGSATMQQGADKKALDSFLDQLHISEGE